MPCHLVPLPGLNASVQLAPVMNEDDPRKGLSQLG